MMHFNAISWHYATSICRKIKGTAVIKFLQQSFVKKQGTQIVFFVVVFVLNMYMYILNL